MRLAATDYAGLGITEISRTICEWLDWKRPNGRLKNHECRQLLERLQLQGVLNLPDLHRSGRRGPRTVTTDTRSDSQTPIQCSIAGLEPLRLTLIENSNSALWRQFIQRYHYLGCRVPVGAHLRYFVHSAQGQILACLLWTSPAWKMAARDRWIGWCADQRARNLQYIVNNSRFLILPWVQVKGLASKILARSARQVPHDWHQHYGYTPLLLETLVDLARFKGTCYRAANGLLWEKPPAEEEWIVTTKRSALKNGFSSFPSTGASNSNSVPSIRPVSQSRMPTNAVNKYEVSFPASAHAQSRSPAGCT